VGDGIISEVDAAGEDGPIVYLSHDAGALEASGMFWWKEEGIFDWAAQSSRLVPGASGSRGLVTPPGLDLWDIALRELSQNESQILQIECAGRPTLHSFEFHPLLSSTILEGVFQTESPLNATVRDRLESVLPFTSLYSGAHQMCLPRLLSVMKPSSSSPPHSQFKQALTFLQQSYDVDSRGAVLLLKGAARARLRSYPNPLSHDVASLIADAVASVVLELETEEDGEAFIVSLLSYVNGGTDSLPCCNSSSAEARPDSTSVTPLHATLQRLLASIHSVKGQGGLLNVESCFCLAHFGLGRLASQSGEETVLRGRVLRTFRAALLPPRQRAMLMLLVTEKVVLLEAARSSAAPG